MNKRKFYDILSKDEILKSQVTEKYHKEISRIKELIILRDKMKHPNVDESENVVDVDVLDIPILAALIDAHYQGMFTQYKRTEE